MLNSFKEKCKAGETVYGPFMKTGDPAFVEIAGLAGFDFVILDMEHGPVSFENLQNLVRAAIISGAVPIVRTSDSSDISIGRALDIGAYGVQVPQISTAREARSVVRAARFYPSGERGVCRFVRAAAYSSMKGEDYFNGANQALVILQLEGRKAIDNLDEILAVEGIDLVFIGPYDLSQSLGFPGQVEHPEVLKEMRYISDRARARGVITGTFTDTPMAANRWRDAGVQYISYSVDTGIFMDACKEVIKSIK